MKIQIKLTIAHQINSDSSKKAQEVIFTRKVNTLLTPSLNSPLTFNNVDVGQIRSQKHLGMFLDFKLSFHEHLETVFANVNGGIANFKLCYQERLF